jgi:uroporphyrinogen-III synthase
MIIFLSKDIESCPEWINWCAEKGIQTHCFSFIHFEAAPFICPQDVEVVFFTSPRSVRFFLEACPQTNAIYACIGKGTADALAAYGKQPAFIGSNPANPEEVATAFKTWLGDRRVFFPISDQSLRSISGILPDSQKQEAIVYYTREKTEQIAPCDWYVFTSPSNARAFLSANSLPEHAQIVAWGKSTARFLTENGIAVTKVLEDSSVPELIHFFEQIVAR